MWLLLLPLLAAATALPAQSTWTMLPPMPSAWPGTVCASFDTARNRLHANDGNDHWVFDGSLWQPSGATPPAGVSQGSQMAYDSARDRTVFVSGNATWGFHGSGWSLLSAQAPVRPHGLVWHAQRQTLVAFSDTGLHEWNGSQWQAVTASGSAPPPAGVLGFQIDVYDLAYDPARAVVAVFGQTQPNLGAIWEWHAAAGWQQAGASGLAGAAVARFGIDPTRDRYLAVVPGATLGSDEVWERPPGNQGSWTLRAQTPIPTGQGHLVFDPIGARVLMLTRSYGGMQAYQGAHPALYHRHGDGCTSSPFDSVLRPANTLALPYAGGSFAALVTGTQAPLGLLVTGLSDQQAAGAPLPASLAPVGMGNCQLRVSPDVLTVMTPLDPSTLQGALQMGPAPAALGFPFFQQAMVLAPGANPFGALMTNSMRGVKGLP
jgi:hypothetical protein